MQTKDKKGKPSESAGASAPAETISVTASGPRAAQKAEPEKERLEEEKQPMEAEAEVKVVDDEPAEETTAEEETAEEETAAEEAEEEEETAAAAEEEVEESKAEIDEGVPQEVEGSPEELALEQANQHDIALARRLGFPCKIIVTGSESSGKTSFIYRLTGVRASRIGMARATTCTLVINQTRSHGDEAHAAEIRCGSRVRHVGHRDDIARAVSMLLRSLDGEVTAPLEVEINTHTSNPADYCGTVVDTQGPVENPTQDEYHVSRNDTAAALKKHAGDTTLVLVVQDITTTSTKVTFPAFLGEEGLALGDALKNVALVLTHCDEPGIHIVQKAVQMLRSYEILGDGPRVLLTGANDEFVGHLADVDDALESGQMVAGEQQVQSKLLELLASYARHAAEGWLADWTAKLRGVEERLDKSVEVYRSPQNFTADYIEVVERLRLRRELLSVSLTVVTATEISLANPDLATHQAEDELASFRQGRGLSAAAPTSFREIQEKVLERARGRGGRIALTTGGEDRGVQLPANFQAMSPPELRHALISNVESKLAVATRHKLDMGAIVHKEDWGTDPVRVVKSAACVAHHNDAATFASLLGAVVTATCMRLYEDAVDFLISLEKLPQLQSRRAKLLELLYDIALDIGAKACAAAFEEDYHLVQRFKEETPNVPVSMREQFKGYRAGVRGPSAKHQLRYHVRRNQIADYVRDKRANKPMTRFGLHHKFQSRMLERMDHLETQLLPDAGAELAEIQALTAQQDELREKVAVAEELRRAS